MLSDVMQQFVGKQYQMKEPRFRALVDVDVDAAHNVVLVSVNATTSYQMVEKFILNSFRKDQTPKILKGEKSKLFRSIIVDGYPYQDLLLISPYQYAGCEAVSWYTLIAGLEVVRDYSDMLSPLTKRAAYNNKWRYVP
ncbi:hypothetical protein CEXT_79681 [Caerostris extrusa]|uniref:Uncharacterized protein n=1 Tax=Caerostris extrusa TaxID=172846 RepID=A0AAV4UWQ5_CAEEX|nr:hypothetical protein CEXT_79681 [Caerostris extrusa]